MRIVLFVAAGLVCGAAHAAQWVAFSDDVHLDVDSIRTVDATAPVVAAWFKLTGDLGRYPDKPKAVQGKTRIEANCKTGELRLRGNHLYDRKGQVVHQNFETSPWMSPPPESHAELMMGAACAAWAKLKAEGLLPN